MPGKCCVKKWKPIFCHCDPLSGLLHSNCCWKCRKAVKSLAGTFYGWSSILTKLGQWLPDTILGRHVLPNIFCRWIVGQNYFGAWFLMARQVVAPWRRNWATLWVGNLVICCQFGICLHCPAVFDQYQNIGLLDAKPTTWMLNWQTWSVHHCRS